MYEFERDELEIKLCNPYNPFCMEHWNTNK